MWPWEAGPFGEKTQKLEEKDAATKQMAGNAAKRLREMHYGSARPSPFLRSHIVLRAEDASEVLPS